MRSYILGAVGTSMLGNLRRKLRLAPEALPAEQAAAPTFLRGQGGHQQGGHAGRAARRICRFIDRIARLESGRGDSRLLGALGLPGFSTAFRRGKPGGNRVEKIDSRFDSSEALQIKGFNGIQLQSSLRGVPH